MQLTVIGRYGPCPKNGGATSSYLLTHDNTKMLFELGSGAFSKLQGFVSPSEVDALILSHSHFDHICDLGVYAYYIQAKNLTGANIAPLKVYVPAPALDEFSEYAKLKELCIIGVETGKVYQIGGLELEFYQMNHTKTCYGFTARANGRAFAYTGDTNVCESFDRLCDRADLLLADGCFIKQNYSADGPHLSVGVVVETAKKYGVKRVIITHLYPEISEEYYINEASDGANIAQEGQVYDI